MWVFLRYYATATIANKIQRESEHRESLSTTIRTLQATETEQTNEIVSPAVTLTLTALIAHRLRRENSRRKRRK